jgi:MarR family transcriptional regulator, transcriptional regulator for hemolysin
MARPPLVPPIGLRLARTARVVTQAFERRLAEAGGSVAAWQVLVLVRAREWGTQAQMAEAMGITSATLTHHLNALERQGLVRRWREEHNRRSQRVELTHAGAELFDRLRTVAVHHDERLRSQLTDDDLGRLAELLDTLLAGLADESEATNAAAVSDG